MLLMRIFWAAWIIGLFLVVIFFDNLSNELISIGTYLIFLTGVVGLWIWVRIKLREIKKQAE